ncbi:STAS domain-containing protein [Spirillospora sp. NPDC127200]
MSTEFRSQRAVHEMRIRHDGTDRLADARPRSFGGAGGVAVNPFVAHDQARPGVGARPVPRETGVRGGPVRSAGPTDPPCRHNEDMVDTAAGAAGAAAPELQVEVSTEGGYAVVVAVGSIELATGAVLDARLRQAAGLTRAAVLLDVTAVRFLDSSGLQVLVRWHRRLVHRGMTLVVCGAGERVTRALEITGLDRALYLHADVARAVRWLDHG